MNPVTSTSNICIENASSAQNPSPHICATATGWVPSNRIAAAAAIRVSSTTKMKGSGRYRSISFTAGWDRALSIRLSYRWCI